MNAYDVKKYVCMYVKKKKFNFFVNVNLDEVRMMFVGLSVNSERSTMPVLSRV